MHIRFVSSHPFQWDPKGGSPLLRSPHGVGGSILSSESSLSDLAEFSDEGLEKTKAKESHPATPTNFRRFTLQQSATSQDDQSPKWEHDEINRVNTSRTDGSDEERWMF
jgi:hypothetical protein